MRGYDQIVVMNPEVAHRSVRQIELEGLPVVAIVKRDPHAGFGAGEQQTFANGVFAYGVDGANCRASRR